jgi:hypothetical protein
LAEARAGSRAGEQLDAGLRGRFALSFPLAICVGIGLAEGDSVDAGAKEWVLGEAWLDTLRI